MDKKEKQIISIVLGFVTALTMYNTWQLQQSLTNQKDLLLITAKTWTESMDIRKAVGKGDLLDFLD